MDCPWQWPYLHQNFRLRQLHQVIKPPLQANTEFRTVSLNLPNYLSPCRGKAIPCVCWWQSLKLVLNPRSHNDLTESSARCAESREGVRLTRSTVSPEYRSTLCAASAGGGQEASLSCTALCRVCLKIHNQNVCCKALCGSTTTRD